MKLFKAVTTLCCVALMGAALTTTARADDYNRKTVFTFSGPVEIPAVHLKGFGCVTRRHLCIQDRGFEV